MEYKHNPPTLAELRQYRRRARNERRETKMNFSKVERLALAVTHVIGSLGFFFFLTAWTVLWLVWNIFGPLGYRFDPAPAFVIWLFASNILQLIFLPLVMVGQNLEGKFAEHRAQADFEINQKAEHEIEIVIAHLENQNELILELARKIDRK